MSVFTALADGDDAREMRRVMAPFVAFFPGPTVELARKDLDHLTRLAAALR